MGADPAEIAERLSGISEELADLALDRLREATEAVRSGGAPDPELTGEEKRITRARRSVDKAVTLLVGSIRPEGCSTRGRRVRRGAGRQDPAGTAIRLRASISWRKRP